MKDNPCIRIGHLKIVDHLILGIADLHLKNNETNLIHSTLEPVAMNGWDQVCDGLTQGDIHGAFITVPLAMDLFSSGLDIKLLMFTHRSGSIIVKHKAPGINRLADFKDKTVLIPSELCIQNMLLHRLLSSAQLTFNAHDDISADVVREVANPFLMTEMLMNDQDNDIAGFAVEEPFGSQAILTGVAAKVCTSESLWKNHPCCAFVLKTSFLEHHRKAAEEMVSLFVRTAKHLEKSTIDDLVLAASLFFDQKKEVIRHVLSHTAIRFDPSLLIPEIDVLNMIQNYMTDSMGVLHNKIDMNHLVDSSFILNALSENSH